MKNSLTIRNADVILPQSKQKVDVSVVDGRIASIGKNLVEKGEIIDAEGLFLIPGIIDPQVHFREPGDIQKEDLHSGSCAAAAGGVTSFLDMPNNNPPITTFERMKDKKKLAADLLHLQVPLPRGPRSFWLSPRGGVLSEAHLPWHDMEQPWI